MPVIVADNIDTTTRWNNRLNFSTLSAWLVASITVAMIALTGYGVDFHGYYAAAIVARTGGNPYDFHAITDALLAATGRTGNFPYYYAPWFAWLLIPFTLFSFENARIFWMATNLILWNLSLWNLKQFFDGAKTDWPRWLFNLFATLVFAWRTMFSEQTGILLFALFVGLLLSLQNEKWVLAGFYVTLLLIKPNVTILPVVAIMLFLIRQRLWRPVISSMAFTSGLLVIFFLVTPNWYEPFSKPDFGRGIFFENGGSGAVFARRISTTLHDWLMMMRLPQDLIVGISLLACLVGLLVLGMVVYRSQSLIRVMAVALLVDFAVTPYAHQYDYPSILLVLCWALMLSRFGIKKWINTLVFAMALFIVSVMFWERPISDGYWIVIGTMAITVLTWFNMDKALAPQYIQ